MNYNFDIATPFGFCPATARGCSRATVALCLLLAGCSDGPSTPAADETGTTTATGGVVADTSTGAPGDSETGDTTTTGDSTGTGGETEGETDTGDPDAGPVSLEVLIRRDDASGWSKNFLFRVTDGVAEGPVLAHEGRSPRDWAATPLSDHRVLYRVDGFEPDVELHLGTLDDPLPAPTVRIDVPGGGEGSIDGVVSVRNGEMVLYARENMLYRIDVSDLEASPPVSISALYNASSISTPEQLDPQGRYLVVLLPADESGNSEIARISLADGTATPIETVGADELAAFPALSSTGDGAFHRTSEGGGAQSLTYVDLRSNEPEPPVVLLSGVTAPDEVDWSSASDGVRPHPDAPGIVAVVGDTTGPTFQVGLSYHGIDDGVALPPVALHAPNLYGTLRTAEPWSPDGRTLLFTTYDDGDDAQVWLAQFDDGHDPVVSPVGGPTDFFELPKFQWSPQSDELYVAHFSDPELAWTVTRRRILDRGVADPEPLVGPFRYFNFQDVRDDGSLLLFSASVTEDEGGQIYGVDLTGEGPHDPVVLSGSPAPDEFATFASFAPDDRVVAYGARTGISAGQTRLMLVEVADPGQAFEVADGLSGPNDWTFLRPDDR